MTDLDIQYTPALIETVFALLDTYKLSYYSNRAYYVDSIKLAALRNGTMPRQSIEFCFEGGWGLHPKVLFGREAIRVSCSPIDTEGKQRAVSLNQELEALVAPHRNVALALKEHAC